MTRGVRKSLLSPPHAVRAGRKDFAQLVRSAPPSPVLLPLTHVTDGYSFRDIMGQEALIPSHCHVFKCELIYLFYGRPAYRASSEMDSNGSDAYWPVCFVLKPGSASATRIYPFDSGAFHYKRFERFMYHKMIKEDFELDVDPSTPGRLLKLFWSDEISYYNVDGRSVFSPGPLDFEARAYAGLIRDQGRAPFDERNSAIEIQVDKKIDLQDNTLAVILPHSFATTEMLSKIDDLGALALPFDVVRRHSADQMVGLIYSIVRDLLGGKHGGGRGKCW